MLHDSPAAAHARLQQPAATRLRHQPNSCRRSACNSADRRLPPLISCIASSSAPPCQSLKWGAGTVRLGKKAQAGLLPSAKRSPTSPMKETRRRSSPALPPQAAAPRAGGSTAAAWQLPARCRPSRCQRPAQTPGVVRGCHGWVGRAHFATRWTGLLLLLQLITASPQMHEAPKKVAPHSSFNRARQAQPTFTATCVPPSRPR
jgi:hypothetical protein